MEHIYLVLLKHSSFCEWYCLVRYKKGMVLVDGANVEDLVPFCGFCKVTRLYPQL